MATKKKLEEAVEWQVFFFEGKGWYDVVDSEEKFLDLLEVHNNNLEELLGTKRLPVEEEKRFTGKLPRFSNRNNYVVGGQTLGEWLEENKINLAFARKKK